MCGSLVYAVFLELYVMEKKKEEEKEEKEE